jgi:ribosomal protein S18 acetylase RimI-like enzyme
MNIARIDENLFEFYAYAASAVGKKPIRGNGFSYVSFQPSPWANTVYSLDFSEGTAVPDALVEGIRAQSIPNSIRVGPTSRPYDVETRLADSGFMPGKVATGMTLDMRNRRRCMPPSGLTVGPIKSDEDVSDFARIVVAELFCKGPETGPAFSDLLSSFAQDRAFGFLGKVSGKGVSAAFAFIDGEGEGGIYFVATDSKMRGRSYARATVSAVLDELELRGVGSCILHATELGNPVYKSLGFQEACRLVQYSSRILCS